MQRLLLVATVVLAASSGEARADGFGTHPCSDSVRQAAGAYGIGGGDVERVYYQARTQGGGESRRLAGYIAWSKLTSCNGDLVVNMRRSCAVTDAYQTGDCAFPGLPKH